LHMAVLDSAVVEKRTRDLLIAISSTGTGTNLKVGVTGPKRKWGAPIRRGKILFGRAPVIFGSKSTISRFGERVRDGQYSLISFVFAVLLTVAPVPSHL